MLFHSAGDAIRAAAKHPVPIKELVGFDRVVVTPDTPGMVSFLVGDWQLSLVDENGDRQLVKGDHTITVTNGVDQTVHFPVPVPVSRVVDTVPPVPAPYSPPPPPQPTGTWLCAHDGQQQKCMPTGGTLSKSGCASTCK